MLQAATRLTRLSLLNTPARYVHTRSLQWAALCDMLASLPRLSRLDMILDRRDPFVPLHVLHACTRLAIMKPSLQLDISPTSHAPGGLLNEMLDWSPNNHGA